MGKRSRNLGGLYDIHRMDQIIRPELTAMGAESSLANKNFGCGHKILPLNTEPSGSTLNGINRIIPLLFYVCLCRRYLRGNNTISENTIFYVNRTQTCKLI